MSRETLSELSGRPSLLALTQGTLARGVGLVVLLLVIPGLLFLLYKPHKELLVLELQPVGTVHEAPIQIPAGRSLQFPLVLRDYESTGAVQGELVVEVRHQGRTVAQRSCTAFAFETSVRGAELVSASTACALTVPAPGADGVRAFVRVQGSTVRLRIGRVQLRVESL